MRFIVATFVGCITRAGTLPVWSLNGIYSAKWFAAVVGDAAEATCLRRCFHRNTKHHVMLHIRKPLHRVASRLLLWAASLRSCSNILLFGAGFEQLWPDVQDLCFIRCWMQV